jgi:putative ATP-grasp target RiPP
VTSSAEQLAPARPWGAGRLAPYPATVHRPHVTVSIDPLTQIGEFRDRLGHGQDSHQD